MSKWKENDLSKLMDDKYFPNCIECSEHYLDETQRNYFHKEGCTQTLLGDKSKMPFELISSRLDERLEVFEKRHGKGGSSIRCRECGAIAVGEMHIFYHNTTTTIEKWPVCMDHAWHEDSRGRESQFKGF